LLQDIKPTKGDMPHEKNNVLEFASRDVILDPLIALFRSGAQQLITQTVEAELEELLGQHSGRRTDDCNAAVAPNGHLPERDLETGLDPVKVKIRKVRSKTGEPVTCMSSLVPPYLRKTKSLEGALPWLYLKGLMGGEMG
jgi:putative transposase